MLTWLDNNKSWLFNGGGVVLVTGGVAYLWRRFHRKPRRVNSDDNVAGEPDQKTQIAADHLAVLKDTVTILFIDDDTKFRVVDILVRNGWKNTRKVRDISAIDDPLLRDSHIVFIDIQGVGVKLGFNDQGLVLALAVRKKYPRKKIVIYSAETKGDRFHKALREADSFLPKNAEPYEFQQVLEQLASEVAS